MPLVLAPGLMPRGGAKGQNLGHCLNKFFALYLEDYLMYKHDTLE